LISKRRWVVIFPEWLASDGDSVLRQNLPTLSAIAERGEVRKLAKIPEIETPESLYLGFGSDKVRLAQGPLTVAALGADPPVGSTHFHLSPMAFQDGIVSEHKLAVPPEQIEIVMDRSKKLNTKRLTIVDGEGLDHALVWEGRGDLGTTQPPEASGKPMRGVLPQGDNEPALRRFIDDSINLLSELEFNAERLDKGLLPINLLWPWGQGIRTAVPNLALMRGSPTTVLTDSLRLEGLSRLAGYRPQGRSWLGNGMNAKWQEAANKFGDATVLVCHAFRRLRQENLLEEASWLTKEIDTWLLDPLFASAKETATDLAILAPSTFGQGLCLRYQTGGAPDSTLPFDERAIEERIGESGLSDVVDAVLQP
jgi:hypothetical protein